MQQLTGRIRLWSEHTRGGERMSPVGSVEIVTQKRFKVFENNLGHEYLGDWQDREGNSNVEEEYFVVGYISRTQYLDYQQGIDKIDKDKAIGGATQLYDANRAVYDLLRYGVKVQPEAESRSKRFG